MKVPQSKKAIKLMENAHPFCEIWFVCSRKLIFTRFLSISFSQYSNMNDLKSVSVFVDADEGLRDVNSFEKDHSQVVSGQADVAQNLVEMYKQRDPEMLEGELPDAGNRVKESHETPIDMMTPAQASAVRVVEILHQQNQEVTNKWSNTSKEVAEQLEQNKQLTIERDTALTKIRLLENQKKQMVAEWNFSMKQIVELRKQKRQVTTERDNAVRRIEKLQEPELQGSQFTSAELRRATQDFNDRFKIGQGGSAVVYKGFLRNTTVAIKMLNPDSSSRGQSEFKQEVTILSRVRHPNVVNFVGACPEVQAIVYEFMPNGSLEDRLEGKAGAPPLPWQARARIITEICSALSFMHKNKPNAIVHGDIKPANILLDHNLVSKLSDFGMSRLLTQSSTTGNGGIYCTSHPCGTLGYMDPEFQTTGELTLQTDTYSFGVTILRVLTAKSPFNLLRVVQNALERGDLSSVMDTSAGEWPITLAMQLASLALRCTDRTRDMRPDMAGEVWSVVKRLADEAAEGASVGSRKHGCCSSVPLNRQQVSIAYHSKCFSGIKIQSVAEAFRR